MTATGTLKGKTAWITGGGSGIGEATARALAEAGAHVIVSGRRAAELDRVAAGIRTAGGHADALPLDVADAQAVARAGAEIATTHGTLDIMVASAGINVPNRAFADLDIPSWDRIVAVNLSGVMYAVSAVLPSMRSAGGGLVVIVSSWVGRHAVKLGGPAYNATKHGLVALGHSLNMEECANGIRACVVMPGEVATDILAKRPAPPPPEELARLLDPSDVARMIRAVCEMPPRACVNEILISPTWNRNFIAPSEAATDTPRTAP
ncbi:SDR family oxidoreductase [Xanthobacter tagetidis]|uniref:SDR family oxidoreductase n=1 Tax=Xanthobacter tagetidis TaxID=60216 RepID=A0A3L7A330_9HYPH|nr:SDR family oxidoreductase [Xanthobacter tagetidis]MBB6307171.1 NADP-dependent 3-hydroxy acid dehydrogenase YdfG [Xanthobacter tagetidis]RLP74011.1 SDR family oxidoreductase [Xanthobacter tagetidis]